MAYGMKYYLPFNNELGERYEIFIQFKDYVGSISNLVGAGDVLTLNYLYESEDILRHSIISQEAIINIAVPREGTVSFEDFITQSDDEIYVQIRKDNLHYIFHGFVVAEQGSQQFKDAPYVIQLKCIDGLGLLKNTPLSDVNGSDFTGRRTFAEVITGILSKANHELHLRTWCDIYEESMINRDADPLMDMFSQTRVETRSFLASEVVFEDCYSALGKLLSHHFIIFYYLGYWNIVRLHDMQRAAPMNYVEYDLDAQIVGSGIGDSIPAKIGRQQRIFTHGEDIAQKSIDYARKKARLQFNYKIPENLVNNQKLSELGAFIAPLSGPGYGAYQLVGWTQKQGTAWTQTPVNNVNAYIKTEVDAYGYERERYYVIEHDPAASAGPLDNFIVNDNQDFWVSKGDRINISFSHRLKFDMPGAGLIPVCNVALWRDGTSGTSSTDWHFMDNDGFWGITAQPINRDLTGSVNATEWETISVEDTHEIPVDGRLFIWFGTGDLSTPNEAHFNNLQITYYPQISGGYSIVKGDFNRYEQNANYKTAIDEEVHISDSPKRIIAGSLFKNDNTLAAPVWYRRGVVEEKRYSQLVAQGVYNLTYRKFRTIEGLFKGYDYEADEGGSLRPFGPMTKFVFSDTGDDRQYIVWGRLTMNVKKGWFEALFREIYKPDSDDGNQSGDQYEFNYLF